jgi:ATP-dependent exoDNAse (exonuclease V) alpha subunit
MEIGVGDRLQLKFNAKSREGLRIANGELVTVRRLAAGGAMVVEDRAGVQKTLEPNQRHFVRGYAVTSYASQGKTVDTVLIADSGCRAATNANQWYVAISRGKKRVAVFTGNKEQLRGNIARSGDRDLALDLQKGAPGKPARRIRSARVRRMLAYGERYRRYHRFMQMVARQTQHIGIHL